MPPITANQIKLIHILKHRLGWDDAFYRDTLAANFKSKRSSKELSLLEGKALIEAMQAALGFEPRQHGRGQHGWGKATHQDLKPRDVEGDLATPAQLRKIEATWRSHPAVRNQSQAALNQFCQRICKVANIRWLTSSQVNRLIHAIEHLSAKETR